MRFLVGLLIVVGLALGVYQLYNYWGNFKEKEPVVNAPPPPSFGESLPGMPQRLQPVLEQAQRRGAAGLHDFLNMYGNTISDPRRAWIELDYVVLEAQVSPGEARRQFAKTKSRVQPGSPVYDRVKELQKTYD